MEDQSTITADMPIGDVVRQYPSTVPIFMGHGLHCLGCALARFENIREGAVAHGINVEVLMEDLNKAIPQAQPS